MRTENGKIENVRRLDADLHLSGMWVGDCHVINGAHLELNGMVTGDLTVDNGCTANVNGTVTGNLTANGQVEVAGVVAGHATGGGLNVLPNARVGER